MNNWFGVNETEASNNTYFQGIYEANGGINPLGAFMEGYLYYDFSYNYAFIMGLKGTRYIGGVTTSPILRDSNKWDWIINSVITYKF